MAKKAIKKKVRSAGGTPAFASAILQIKKEVAPEVGLTTSSVFLLSDLVEVITNRLIATSGRLAAYDEKSTLKTRHVQTAANLVLIGGLAAHAEAFANKALTNYNSGIKA